MKNIAQFVEKNKDNFADALGGTGLFASIFMAQVIQESSGQWGEYGLSGLAHKYHNYGGIVKWWGWDGPTVKMKTGEYTEGGKRYYRYAAFCVYKDFREYLFEKVRFLSSNKRYAHNGLFDARTPLESIAAIKKSGYATDPVYLQRVSSHYNSNKSLFDSLDEYVKKKDNIKQSVKLLPASSSERIKSFLSQFFKIKKYFIPVDSNIVYIDESEVININQ